MNEKLIFRERMSLKQPKKELAKLVFLDLLWIGLEINGITDGTSMGKVFM